jgi:putative Holliday junction resolvase
MALDVGDSRIGVALSDPLEMLATPLIIIKRTVESADVKVIHDLLIEHNVGKLLIGLPISLSGEVGIQAQKVKAFAEVLTESLSVPFEFVDESFSTVAAREYMRETGRKKDRFKKKDDAVAAAVVLHFYLEEASARNG